MRVRPTNRRDIPPDGIRAAAFARLRAKLDLQRTRSEDSTARIAALLAENRELRAAIKRMRD